MKLFDAIGDFLKTLFVPPEVTEKKKKPGAQTHGGFSDGFQKAPNARVNLTGVAPAVIVVPEDKPEALPQPDNDFVASLDDLPIDAAPIDSMLALQSDAQAASSNDVTRALTAASPESTNAALTPTTSEPPIVSSQEALRDAPTNESIPPPESSNEVASVQAASGALAPTANPSTSSLMAAMGALSVSSNEAFIDEPPQSADESTRALIEMMNDIIDPSMVPQAPEAVVDTSTSELMAMMNEVIDGPVEAPAVDASSEPADASKRAADAPVTDLPNENVSSKL